MAARPDDPTQQVTFIYTHDLDGTSRFYAETIGLPLVLDQGPCRIYRVAAEAFLGVCQRANREVAPAGVTVTFVVEDVGAWHDYLQRAGVAIDGPPEVHEAFNVESFFARDPSGYRLEFQRFLDPAWPRPSGA